MSNNIIQFPRNNNITPQLISEDIYKEQLLLEFAETTEKRMLDTFVKKTDLFDKFLSY